MATELAAAAAAVVAPVAAALAVVTSTPAPVAEGGRNPGKGARGLAERAAEVKSGDGVGVVDDAAAGKEVARGVSALPTGDDAGCEALGSWQTVTVAAAGRVVGFPHEKKKN